MKNQGGGMIVGERWEEEQLKILFKLYEIKDFEIFLLNFEFWECCGGNYASNVFFSFTILSHSSSSLLLFYLTHLLLFYYFISLIFFSFTILSHSSSSLILFYLTHLLLFYYFISLIFFSFTILPPFLLLPSSLISFPFTSIFFFLSTQFDLPFTVSLLHYLLFSPFLTSVYFYSNSLL